MSDPAGQAELAAFLTQMKRRQRYAMIAGFTTLAVVILMVFLAGNDSLKSYSFFVGVIPALAVYFFVAYYGLKRPKI